MVASGIDFGWIMMRILWIYHPAGREGTVGRWFGVGGGSV